MATKRSEVFGKFNLFGISSRVPFLTKIYEEFRIRIFNRQNFFQVFLVTIAYLAYYLLNKIEIDSDMEAKPFRQSLQHSTLILYAFLNLDYFLNFPFEENYLRLQQGLY